MPSNLQKLRLRQIDSDLKVFRDVTRVPSTGWLSVVRGALGLSKSAVARKLGVAPTTVLRYESGEAAGTITLETLRKYADALDCDMVYGLVPRASSLESLLRQRARFVAERTIRGVAYTMALESQAPPSHHVQEQIEELAEELVRTRSAELWRDM